MKRLYAYALIPALLLGLTLAGCAIPQKVTKGEEFPLMYQEAPRSIVILPPMNETTAAEAKDYYMTTIEQPFAHRITSYNVCYTKLLRAREDGLLAPPVRGPLQVSRQDPHRYS